MIMPNWFQKFVRGDTLRKVVQAEAENVVHRFLEELTGMGCWVSKHHDGSRPCIIVDGNSDVPFPPDVTPPWFNWSFQANTALNISVSNGANNVTLASVENQWCRTTGNTIEWKPTAIGTYRITARVQLEVDAENMLNEFFELSFKTGGNTVTAPCKYRLFLEDNSGGNTYADDEQSVHHHLYVEGIVTQYPAGATANTTSVAIVSNTVELVLDAVILQTGWYVKSSVVTVERLHEPLADTTF